MQNERGGEAHLSHEDLHAVAKQFVEENELQAGRERIESGAGVRLYLTRSINERCGSRANAQYGTVAGVRLYLTRSMIIEVLHGISNVHVLLILHMC